MSLILKLALTLRRKIMILTGVLSSQRLGPVLYIRTYVVEVSDGRVTGNDGIVPVEDYSVASDLSLLKLWTLYQLIQRCVHCLLILELILYLVLLSLINKMLVFFEMGRNIRTGLNLAGVLISLNFYR